MISKIFRHATPQHLRGTDFEVRRGKGREWNQLKRIRDEAKAVKMIERQIDAKLGPGEGRKLLKEIGKDTGDVYGRFGAAHITQDQADRALDKAEQLRLMGLALHGPAVEFRLPGSDVRDLHQELIADLNNARPTKAGQLDEQFQKDKHRLTSLKLIDKGRELRDLSSEWRNDTNADSKERDDAVTNALLEFARISKDEDADVVANRAFCLSVLVNQRTIASAYTRACKMLGGQPVGKDEISVSLQKFKDRKGETYFGVHITSEKPNVGCFDIVKREWNERHKEWQDVTDRSIETDPQQSSFFVDQDFHISADDLAKRNSEGLIIKPVKITARMIPV